MAFNLVRFTTIALTFGIAGPVNAAILLLMIDLGSLLLGFVPNDPHSRSWAFAAGVVIVPALYFVIPGILTGSVVGWAALKGWMPFNDFWRAAIISVAVEFLYLVAIPGPVTAMGIGMILLFSAVAAVTGVVCWWLVRGVMLSNRSPA